MAADPELTKVANDAVFTVFKVTVPIIIVSGIIGIGIAYLRRNTGEAMNRFFWRRSKTEKKCPKDGGTLMKRRGKYGPFLGCSNYPKCTYTEGGSR